MKILCIAASNSRKALENSVSYKVCQIVGQEIQNLHSSNHIEINAISLKEYDLHPCQLCGNCSDTGRCLADPAFDLIFKAMKEADKLLFVVPHYAPLPSKLMILFEKINEMTYAGWLKDPNFLSPIQNKTFAVIGHGGMTETPEVLQYYHDTLVRPAARTLQSLGLHWAKPEKSNDLSAVFGLSDDSCLKEIPEALFPEILMDNDRISDRIAPLIEAFMK